MYVDTAHNDRFSVWGYNKNTSSPGAAQWIRDATLPGILNISYSLLFQYCYSYMWLQCCLPSQKCLILRAIKITV